MGTTGMSNIVKRDDVIRLENIIKEHEQVDLNTTHCIINGMYARTIFIPEGTVLTGATHKTDHINIINGDISVSTDEGIERISGYFVISTKAGKKRVGYAHAGTYWTTICKTEKTELEDIENDLVEESNDLQTRNNLISFENIKELENT